MADAVMGCQIVYASTRESGLCVHTSRGDGTPRCGQPVRPWHGQEMVLIQIDHPVTCGRCKRIVGL